MSDVRDSVRGRLRREWITRHARGLRWRVMRAVVNRVATREMRHAALLLGYDIALGHGREGIFRYLDGVRHWHRDRPVSAARQA